MLNIGALPPIPPLRHGAESEPTQRILTQPLSADAVADAADAVVEPIQRTPSLYKVLAAFAALGALFAWVRALRRRAHAF